MRGRWSFTALVAAAMVTLAGCGFLSNRATETYTVAVAGVVTQTDSTTYSLEGRRDSLQVSFIASAAARVGDLLLAGEGASTWGYAARKLGAECWSIRATSSVEGGWIDANIGDAGGRPGVDIHIRIPKADDFEGGVASDGQILGNTLCLDSSGKAVSAE
jgi:hypothetical protein